MPMHASNSVASIVSVNLQENCQKIPIPCQQSGGRACQQMMISGSTPATLCPHMKVSLG